MRRDVVLVLLIAAAALGIRIQPAWDSVFSSSGVSFLETDAWYHVRLAENQVRNFPWRVTNDPFASAGAQFVPIAPLYDTVTSAVVVILFGGDATTSEVERVAAWLPPVFGALTIIAVWALSRRLFDRRAALIAAALAAVLPGHFLDRTMLGFVDHHALEALLAMAVLLTIVRAVQAFSIPASLLAGLALAAYLLTWGSGAFLVAIIGVWLTAFALLAPRTTDIEQAATAIALCAVIALAAVLLLQDPAMHRYGTQLFGVAGLAALAAALATAMRASLASRYASLAIVAAAALAVVVIAAVVARDVIQQVVVDVARFTPDPSRMGVLEARPLFLYSGNWDWMQPWRFFRTGIVIGAIALIPFATRVWRHRRAVDLLLLTYTVAVLAATIGQNRFGYYLVPACALLGGWLAMELLDWAGVPHALNKTPAPRTRLPLAREAAVIAIAGGMFAPNLAPSVLLAERSASFPIHWRQTMEWLRQHTPPPFGAGADTYYYANYDTAGLQPPDYTVLSWWDQGYWITQQARRVPVANPTQERAATAAAFYTAIDDAAASAIAAANRTRYVLADFELPFRRIADGSIMGRFQTIVDWTGKRHDDFYEVAYRREGGQWVPTWLFYEPYYRSMAFRLATLGGAGATPSHATTVVALVSRVDNNGFRFREIVTQETYATFEHAQRMQATLGADAVLAGLDPWQPAFPLEPLSAFTEIFATPVRDGAAPYAPRVRVFEVR